MKSFIFASISTFIILNIFAIFLVSILLIDCQKTNKNENWEKTQETRQLEQLIKSSTKELKNCKTELNTLKNICQ
jgi:mannitol-specific phosphotransferase system IIBC component